MWSAPALAKACKYGSAGAIIRCTSRSFGVLRRSALTTSGPMVMLGTKWPSITSTWIQSAPAASTARTSSPSLAKFAERIEGAISSGRIAGSGKAFGEHGDGEPATRQAERSSVLAGPRANRLQTLGNRLEQLRHEVDRELGDAEIEPNEIRDNAAGRRQHQAEVAVADRKSTR